MSVSEFQSLEHETLLNKVIRVNKNHHTVSSKFKIIYRFITKEHAINLEFNIPSLLQEFNNFILFHLVTNFNYF